jgi:hypothetical protein
MQGRLSTYNDVIINNDSRYGIVDTPLPKTAISKAPSLASFPGVAVSHLLYNAMLVIILPGDRSTFPATTIYLKTAIDFGYSAGDPPAVAALIVRYKPLAKLAIF